MTNHYKPKVKKCVNCDGEFRRKGESYYHEGGYFCSGKCSKEFGISVLFGTIITSG